MQIGWDRKRKKKIRSTWSTPKKHGETSSLESVDSKGSEGPISW